MKLMGKLQTTREYYANECLCLYALLRDNGRLTAMKKEKEKQLTCNCHNHKLDIFEPHK